MVSSRFYGRVSTVIRVRVRVNIGLRPGITVKISDYVCVLYPH